MSVPPEALEEGKKLRNEILLINIIETKVTSATTSYYTPENEKVEEGYLKTSFLQEWSPIGIGEVGKQKELSDFINLLNLNPDRYISATVSKGTEPDMILKQPQYSQVIFQCGISCKGRSKIARVCLQYRENWNLLPC